MKNECSSVALRAPTAAGDCPALPDLYMSAAIAAAAKQMDQHINKAINSETGLTRVSGSRQGSLLVQKYFSGLVHRGVITVRHTVA
jgi:hypothetical protein